MSEVSLRTESIDFAYYHGLVLREVSLRLGQGELVALIGPNGSGKTTLLRILSGILSPLSGGVWLDGRELGDFSRKEIAQKIAVVPQSLEVPFGFTVKEMVLLGRTPYLRPWRGVTREDGRAVEEAMSWVGMGKLTSRPFNELSGGERQQVILAMALAQEPEILLLDEPTVHLDIAHQQSILDLVRRLNQEKGLTVLAAIHDLNLAALYFPRLLLLDRGRLVADGSPWEVLNQEQLATVFGAEVVVEKHPQADRPQILLVPKLK